MAEERGKGKSREHGAQEGHLAFSPETWASICGLLGEARPGASRGRPRSGARLSLEAAAWKLLSGKPWSALPAGLGKRSTAHRRFQRWEETGAFGRLRRWVLRRLDDASTRGPELLGLLLLAKALGGALGERKRKDNH